jgi:hypothetical protein
VDFPYVDEGRRGFLTKLVAAGFAGFAGLAGSVAAPRASSAAVVPAAGAEVLDEPIVLRNGETLANRVFLLSRQFRSQATNGIIVVNGHGVRIRDVRIVGPSSWDPRWNDMRPAARDLPGVFANTSGIRIRNVRDVVVERVSIEGMPRAGISAFGVDGGLFRDITIRHCFSGINFTHDAPSHGVLFERVHTLNQWGPMGKVVKDASFERPGGWIGGDGLALNSLRDSTILDCTAVGEMFAAFKVTNPQRVRLAKLRGAGLMVQGTAGTLQRQWSIHKQPARDVVVEDCVFDKGLGRGRSLFEMNCLQLSQNVASIDIRRCVLNAAGQNGHGIQMTRSVHGRVMGCMIRGFNGVRGENPAHAVDLAWGSSVNADFEHVNEFANQRRIRLDRN